MPYFADTHSLLVRASQGKAQGRDCEVCAAGIHMLDGRLARAPRVEGKDGKWAT